MTSNTPARQAGVTHRSSAVREGQPGRRGGPALPDVDADPSPRPDAGIFKRFGEDLTRMLDDSGISIRRVAAAAGIDHGYLARIVRGLEHPTMETLLRIGAAVNGTVSVRLYPNAGPSIKDRWQAPMLEVLLAHAAPRWNSYLEVGVLRPDKGWIDAVLHDPLAHQIVSTEVQSELRRLETLIRWHAAKTRSLRSWEGFDQLGDDPRVSQLLVVRRTRANLEVVRGFPHLLRAQYPAHPDDAVAALAGNGRWPGAAMVWMQVDGGRARFIPGR